MFMSNVWVKSPLSIVKTAVLWFNVPFIAPEDSDEAFDMIDCVILRGEKF